MKKNISINISGIIFHIEEDGYDTLKKYLDSINKYFSSFEDSSEILADIESRIAEIFLSKLNEEKQVITAEDVSALVATMGSVSDFKAAEEQEEKQKVFTAEEAPSSAKAEGSASGNQSNYTYTPPKQLYRDQVRKILGGVCSGLGNYFNIDPLWIRLIFAVLFFAWGITLFVYIVMWVVVPGSFSLDEPVVSRKMFRDPQRKVIAGVSGGVAAYLGIDIVIVRLLFIILLFGAGVGLFLYIVLWIILPEAKTITDKMQMQGEPVTLSNIETNIKRNFNIKDGAEESTATKILLFPFRLIGMILTSLGKILAPLIDVVRVFIGVIIILIGVVLLLSTIVVGGILLGFFTASIFSGPWAHELREMNFPAEVMMNGFPGWVGIAGIVALAIPSIFMILLGASAIAKRIVFQGTAGWTLFAVFFISIVMLAVGIPKIAFSWREEGEHKVETNYKVNGKTAVLKVREHGNEGYEATRLTLRGYEGKDFRLVQSFEAQGSSRAKAIENAKMVEYNVSVTDSVFVFDRNLQFMEGAIFRGQHLDMILYIPYNFPFIMDEEMSRFITQYVDYDYTDGYTWQMTEHGLECINCTSASEKKRSELVDFDEVEITGRFDLRIVHGDNYAVELIGPEREKEKYKVYRSGETLIIDFERKRKSDNWDFKDLRFDEVTINVTMPALEKIEAVGAGSIRIDEFKTDDVHISTRGPIKTRGSFEGGDITINLSGSSEADLDGSASNLNAHVEFASKLRAYDLEVQDAFVEVSGASSAKVNVNGTLEIDKGVASKIDYRGNPNVIKRD